MTTWMLLQEQINALKLDRDKWHRVAMEVGAVTCADGSHIFPLRDRIKQLEAQLGLTNCRT